MICGVGCVSGSLASGTGPRPPGSLWSVASRQRAHVGERVRFDFAIIDWIGQRLEPAGRVDYVAARFGVERIEVEPDSGGRFQFELEVPSAAGKRVVVDVAAYRRVGRRDRVFAGGDWRRVSAETDAPDELVARDAIELDVYQSEVVLRLDRPLEPFDVESGVLRLKPTDDEVVSVYAGRSGRRGFRMTGPDGDGRFEIRYEPGGQEVRSVGVTPVEFVILDRSGLRHEVSAMIDTP